MYVQTQLAASRLALFIALALPVSGCVASFRTVQLGQLDAELAPFEEDQEFDFVAERFEYVDSDAGSRSQKVMMRLAEIAASIRQARGAIERFRENDEEVRTPKEKAYYQRMVVLSAKIPDLIQESEELETVVDAMDDPKQPVSERVLSGVELVQTLPKMKTYLEEIFAARENLDAILDDYERLQAELARTTFEG